MTINLLRRNLVTKTIKDLVEKSKPSPPPALVPLLISKAQAAAVLGISLRSVTSLIATRQLAHKKIGRRTLVPHASLVEFARHDHLNTKPDFKRMAGVDHDE